MASSRFWDSPLCNLAGFISSIFHQETERWIWIVFELFGGVLVCAGRCLSASIIFQASSAGAAGDGFTTILSRTFVEAFFVFLKFRAFSHFF